MLRSWTFAVGLVFLGGCLVPESRALQAEAEAARCYEALGKENAEKKDLSAEKVQLEQEKEQLIKKNATYDALVAKLRQEVDDKLVHVTLKGDRITVNVSDRILFDSGSADIKESGKESLKKIAGILAEVNDKRIDIEGHTDNAPIKGELAEKFPTNWELSAARATNVVRFLEENGVDPSRMAAVGKSKFRPLVSNKTSKGRMLNRRIDIVLTPWDIPK
jgi:chemotaxis protein MotB